MPSHDIFLCYSSKDEAQARTIVRFLEEQGFVCWIACRDVRPGKNYQESIVQALRAAKSVMFLFSDHSNKTNEVKKELSLASSFEVPVIPFRITSAAPNGALMYELATRQWIDAVGDFDAALEPLVAAIKETLGQASADLSADASAPPAPIEYRSPPRQAAAPAARAPMVAAGTAEFETLRTLLAHHVGPIAKVFVQKASADAATAEEFCQKLAGHVRAGADRDAFVSKVRALLKSRVSVK